MTRERVRSKGGFGRGTRCPLPRGRRWRVVGGVLAAARRWANRSRWLRRGAGCPSLHPPARAHAPRGSGRKPSQPASQSARQPYSWSVDRSIAAATAAAASPAATSDLADRLPASHPLDYDVSARRTLASVCLPSTAERTGSLDPRPGRDRDRSRRQLAHANSTFYGNVPTCAPAAASSGSGAHETSPSDWLPALL